jgi:hypothetical protein
MREKSILGNLPLIIYLFSIFISLLFLTLYFSTGNPNITSILFNSDILYFPTLYKDLFIDHYNLSGWTIPGSPNFFPDMFFYFILMFITGKASYSTFFFAFLQFLTILLLFRHLIKSVFPGYGLYSLTLGNLLLSLFFLVTFIDHDPYMTFHLVSNTYHLGALINVLIAMIFSIEYIRSSRNIYLVFLFILGLLAIISDRLFIVMYCIPFSGALLVFVRKPRNLRKLLFLTLTIALMLVLGFVIFDRITHNNTFHVAKAYFNFSIEGITASWNVLYGNLKLFFIHFKIFTIIIIISIISLLFSLLNLFRSASALWKGFELSDENGLKHLMNIFFILFMITVFFTPVLTGGFQGFDTIRYNIFVFYLGTLFLGVVFIYFFNEKPWTYCAIKISSITALAILSIFMGIYISGNHIIPELKKYFGYYPQVACCIDTMDEKHELKLGVSTYWYGKVGTQFSKRSVRLYTVYNENLVPFPHVGNENWYYESGYGKYDPPVFNFILLEKPVPASALKTIEDRLGKIVLTEEFGGFMFIKVNDFKYNRNSPFPESINKQNIQ